ncbi:IgGFc-binding protein [Morus bassanus]
MTLRLRERVLMETILMEVIFEAVRGLTEYGDTALDNVRVRDGPCEAICSIHGDPHYYTFDRQRHDFMGTCTYTLSKLCESNSSLPYFNVEAANEHRGTNTRVSYIQYVDIDVYGYRINLGKNRFVKVDGVSQVLPLTLEQGVSIYFRGQYVVVTTDFGLDVKFDGNHRAEITLPSTYISKVCGICGNYNGHKADDFLNPDGVMETNSASLGNSWQVYNDSRCLPDDGHTPNCTADEKHMIQSNEYCGLITDPNGPFQNCHSVVDPQSYSQACQYDLCELHLNKEALCQNLQAYADMCQAAGVQLTPWRNATFCPPHNCNLPCVEGCVCDSGYLLYNDRCVPSQRCGCWHNGQHYPVGSEFWTDNTCSSKCRCPARGSKVQCSSASCPAGQYCGVQGGKPECLKQSYGTCHVHSDPHYNTFDKVTHSFMGNCTYTLAKVCSNTTSLPYFNVEAKNEHRGSTRVSYVREVLVEVYGERIAIVKTQRSQVLVNSVRQTLPVSAAGGAITVSRSGRYIVLETDFNLRVSYDTDHSVEVKVPTTYFNLTCGMCGNFNNRREDDYMMPNGQQAADSNALGQSWQVPDGDTSCGVPVLPKPCSAEEEKLYRSDQFCGLLTASPGSFERCHTVINPQSYFETCFYDLCALNGGQAVLCAALEAYADACQAAGVTLLPWRNATFCPVACPPDSHYNPCTSACPATCIDPLASENCSRPCIEGCECNNGFVISGGQCVSMSNCGCLQNGKYYEVNGVQVYPPVDLNHEARVAIKGHYVVIDTSLGIQVKFDGDQEVFILVDKSLKGQLCGLCGTFNDNQLDDFLKPDKVLEQDPNKFGDSWLVKDDNRTCNPVAVLYFESCVYDLCATEGDSDQFCKILEAYAAACELGGVNLGEWWKDTICACSMSCTFDVDFCEWQQGISDNLDWIRHKGPTPTPNTSPSHDHTSGDGYYVYLQGSNVLPGSVAHLVSPVCSSEGPHCFRFWYHMYGAAETMALRVYVVHNETSTLEWKDAGNKGDKWNLGEVTVRSRGSMQIVLEGMIGEDVGSRVALDDLSIEKGYCTVPATCVVEGDPHYHTFDKQLHHFMGTCTYTLSKLCESNSSLPYFNVEAANEHRGGNTRVSYVRYVDVDVAGQRIRLGKRGVVTVNGVAEVLPCTPSAGVQVSSSGFYTVVTTDFGLRVRFDGNHRVEVTLPSTFRQKVCGMCGNYNGMAADDFLNPEGMLEPDSTSLGNSWQVSNDSSCSARPLPTPACNETDKRVIASSHFCGLINDTSGPFRVCHAVLSPSSYFDTCFYDLCELGLDREALCKSLQSYADACQSLDVQIPVWRNATFCPITCPANSHYEPCAAACPATCVDPMAPVICNLPCVEGCVCDSGYLLYNDRCVPSQRCGCWHNGQHYPVGSEFWTDNTCSSKCRCPARGSKVQCSSASCPAGQYCGVQGGKPECLKQSYGTCHVHSDPHYNTFDKVTHSFMGNCTYTLAKVCSNTTSLPYFNVEAKNEHRGSTRVSYVREVLVEVYGERIAIVKTQRSQVLVNSVRQTLPVSAAGGAITVSRSGRYIVLETDFNLRVSYDTDHSVEVKVPTTYFNLTCGMCGNFNNRREDDYMMPNGQQAADSNALGQSWQVPDGDTSCGVPVLPKPCSAEEEKLYRSDQFCGLLTASPGSFERCHTVINPQSYFETCFYDLCALNGGQAVLCAALEAYADACQAAGVTLLPWRNATFCPLLCPANSYYDSCMTGCPATCVDRQAPQNCSKPCMEGCACTSGFLLSGDTCVPEAQCGCLFEGNYYSKGEYSVSENCTRQCWCKDNGQMACSPLSCGEDEVCKVQNGRRGCYPASTALCHIYGDPHYSTFDGKLHHFQGSCNYTVVTGCDNSSVGFSVTTRNKHRGSQSWTALNSVALSMEGLHIALRENKAVYINGALASLPASPAPSVNISLSGSYVRVSTKLGLQLLFNGDHELLVKVSEKHKGKLCGLCGTYTGSRQDDFMRPDGVVVPDFNDFGASWMVPDDEWQCDPYISPPAPCSPSNEAAAKKQCAILTQLGGPFHPCHAVLPPQAYLESCVYDQCANNGSTEQLCNDLRAYAAACAEAGVALGDWSAGTVCGTCVVEGDPHYHTFDKQLHHFMGTCTYTLSKLCESNSLLPYFNVDAANEHALSMSCTFDVDFCEWQQGISDNLDWIRHKGPTPTPNTSPSHDHTSGDGYYVYLQGSNVLPGSVAHLVSPVCSSEGPHCFRFWYHMYGAAETMALRVYVVHNETSTLEWKDAGNKGDKWNLGEVTVRSRGSMQIVLEGMIGEDVGSRVALDDLSIEKGYCTVPATCVVEGDPHYHTFDKQLHHFMGTCTYTLSKLCESNSSLPYFNVEAANEHRGGNTRVSYVRYVDVDVAGQRIRLGKRGVVTVNGVAEVLPCTPSAGVQVSSSGFYTVVTTDFGLRVRFDGNHRVEVTLPSTFRQKVCGMCGNYNGMAADDFLNPEGMLEPDSTSLGNSWQVSNDSSCSARPLPTPACNETDKRVIASSHFCGLINDTSGPFQVCHAVLSPSSYFDTCFYDLCELGLDREALCKSLQSYADACQSLDVQIPVWRNATFCPITCPANSHYEPCAAACPATCVDPSAPHNCNLPCVEGCVCDSGYLLYNDRCVPSQRCGCWHNGQHYPVGSEFWTDNTCSSKCRCPARGSKVQCSSASCPAGQYCGVQGGKPECLKQSYGTCHVHSDPHYNTFDKVTHSFMGNCTYTLAKVCSNTTSLPYFNVEAKNEHRGSTRVSYVREVLVEVYGERIAIVKTQRSQVLVNSVRQTLPVSAAGGAITVSRSGRYIVLETDFNLRVSYDTDHSVEVKVPTTYFNLTCGMCGNFNNRREDDYMMPNGQQAADSNALGQSWQVPDGDTSCGVPVLPKPCSAEEEKLYRSDQFCGLLTASPGSFERCHTVINPQSYFETCFYDLCALNGGQAVLCAALEAYADACQAAGVTLLPWRNATFCPLLCPANSYYDSCMTGCPATCVDRQAPQNCSKPCMEGCACTSGFLLSGDTCVPEAQCGCLFEGNYYSKGEYSVSENCTRQCWCKDNGQMACSPLSCGEDEVCKVQNGRRGCYPASTALCHIYGDPHYSTFDGKLHHFQGSCNYTVVTGCDNSSVGFSVTTRNKHRGSQSWTALNSVALSMEGLHIALRENKAVYINGALASLPASPAPSVNISLSGSYVRVSTKLGLQLLFNGDHELLVKVSEKHKGKLCGLCGTYTGSRQDDFTRPDGVVVPDFNDFGASWMVPDDEWQCDPYISPPAPCSPSNEAAAKKQCAILTQLGGPFHPCHAVLPPQAYLESCVYDQCANNGSTEQLCNDLRAYAAACAEAGVALGDWSAGTVCGTCVVEGDPHYHTFDKQLHHFMGTCTYTLSKLCESNSSLPYFNVEAANEHRGGNTRVSYVRYVDVDVAGQRIRLGKRGVVTVNGVAEVLPCTPSAGVQVSSSGFYTVVTTDFGLRVRFDGNHRVEVTLPSTFRQKVCGMCGNYNGMAADDFLNPEGMLEPDSTSLGNSWQVSNDSSCSARPLPTPACNETDKRVIASSHFCGLINDTSGPFQVCHAVLSPSSYFDTCFYDLCELGLDREALCKSLQSYADACQSLDVQIPVWRNATFCPITCPANSHYEPCAAACPATCVDPSAPHNCNLPCVEGCVCDSGYLLYNDRCVPSQRCGCWHNGQHYPVGSEFWTDNTCSSKCRCPARGSKVQCSSASCPAGQYCGVQGGKPECLKQSYGTCHVHSDPHYNTFDKVTHSFMGNCTYTLAKVCSNTTSLPYFNVEAKNEHRGSTRVSYVREVLVEVYGERIAIVKTQRSQVLVNSVRQTLPVSAAGGAITVSRSGRYIVLETDFNLRVSYDTDHSVEVKVPTTYFNLTCGMCGNFNNRREDDYMMPNGQQAADSNALGQSWQVPDGDTSCGVPVLPKPCSAEEEKLYRSDQFCGLLTASPGSFERCHTVINPQSYFETCFYDLCALNGGQAVLCAALEAYADACQAAGVTLLPWRNATFCPLLCPANSYYDSCMTGCPATCVDRQAPQNCSKPCMEGCACTSGFLLSGDTCVPEAQCGCLFEGNYYSKGEYSVSENCTRQCWCKDNGQMACSPLSCGEDEVCKVQNGRRGCYPASTALCHIYGDPHYSTFDGKLHHFQGSCNYTVVTGCDNSSVGFSVTTRNKHRGSQSWTALNSVALSMEGLHIALRENKAVYINGALASLPASPAPSVNISLSGSYVRVSTKLGLQLLFNGDHELLVKVSEKHKGKLCGLCGTYTGSRQDDFMRPDGVVVPDFNDFGASWMVPDDEWQCDPYISPPAPCSPSNEAAAKKQCAILTQLGGPFHPCHAVLPPQAYLESCVYDQCANNGSTEQLCNDLRAYAAACAEAGVALGDWSAGTVCGTCVVEGDPHYHTFDKQLHHFMGTCTYTLSKLCESNSSLPYFNVEAANEHRGGNTRVSYVRYVDVDVAGQRIRLGKRGVVTVNGVAEVLPCTPSAGVQVSSSGFYTVVTTDFGLRVRFDGNHRVEVTLPSTFRQKVCGMCGNYNGMAADDFLNPEGMLEPDSTSLGNSWQVSNDSSCSARPLPTPACNETDKRVIASSHFCGLINDTSGPFQVCHAVLSPSSYFDTCFYDLCELGLDREALCKSLQSYADACQSLDVQIPVWRNATFCPITCPANSHYEPCAAACPATCVDPSAPHNCNLPCVEGCVCDSGYLLYNDRCVPSQRCGCWHNGQHYPVGSEFWTDNTCSSKCRCPARGSKVQCSSASCPAGQYCGVQGGKPECLKQSYGTCHVHSDPHYNTFDKVTHSFMGNCTYTLAKVCSNTTSLPYFNVEAKNEHRGSTRVSYVREVLVEVYGERIAIVKTQRSQVLVNSVRQTLPVSAAGGAITVSRSGRYIVLETDFNLRVSYDTDHSVEVKVPTTYFNLTCGMCGNFNNRREDDYMMPNGQQAADSNALGQSWQVPDGDTSCGVPVLPKPCSAEEEKLYRSDQFCGLLTASPGSFERCHTVINPQSYFETCFYDLCALNGGQAVLCAALEAYADACQAAGVTLLPWRNATFCPLLCPANSYYDSCMTGCPATCVDRQAPQNCSKPCMEGCACTSGFLLSGDTCVPEAQCGCLFEGNYYSKGEYSVSENCTRQCWCKDNGQMACSPLSCGEDEVCKVQNGRRGCYPASTALCHIYGDPHYSTFDGKLHHFQGSCNYTVVTGCDNSSVGFSVTTRNKHRGSQSWTALNSVALSMEGLHIALRENKAVYINGALASLPASPAPSVNISLSGSYVRVSTKLGLQLLFNGDHELLVKVSEKHKGKLCGLCGTYTGSRQDDFTRPDGVVVPDFNDFGASWMVPDDEWQCDPYISPPAPCSPSNEAAAKKQCAILTQLGGPFHPCHAVLPPQAYLESCVYDQCANNGSTEQLCNDLRAYAAACAEAGVALGDWSAGTVCGRASCSASGDPHYNTFDHRVHHFMGNCTYTLSKVCSVSERLPYFDVSTTNEHRRANNKVSYVNDSRMNLPVFIEKKISIQSSGGYVLLETDFGLWVRYDGNHYAEVSVPSGYSGLLCGLCGNYNGDPNDDNIKPNGDIASGSTDLGQSWLVPESNTTCSSGTEEQCDPVLESEAKKNTACGMIIDPTEKGLLKQAQLVLYDHIRPALKLDESWFTSYPCTERCTCKANNTILCTSWKCGVQEECSIQDGVLGCHSNGQATCQVVGDPHYFTFDGIMYTFLGTCTYTLVEVVNTNSIIPITILGKNEDRGLRGATYLKEVYIDVYSTRIILKKSQQILLNNERVYTPVEKLRGVSIGNVGRFIVVETDFGVIVRYDGNHHLEITLPRSYFSKVHGMCGNFNDNHEDDLSLPNGTLVNAPQFGNSWKVEEDSDEGCLPDLREDDVPPCTAENKPVIESQCNVLKSDKFKACHNLVKPEDFIQICIYDMCQYDGMKSVLCDTIQVYVETCRNHGITIKWRNSTFCRFGKCRIMGDPHYITFDHLVHHFQGKYTYILAQTIPDLPDTLTQFSIEGMNYPFRRSQRISYLKEVLINVYNHTVRFRQNKQLLLDGVRVRPPAHPHEGIRIYQRIRRIYLETDFGLYVNFDGNQNAEIKLANTYRNRVEGLCGNFDGRYRNDFKKPDGVWVRNVNVFGESWKVPLKRSTSRLRSCLFDMCVAGDENATLCRSLEEYVLACQQQGVSMEGWRQQTACGGPCMPDPCKNDGVCSETTKSTSSHFHCECSELYTGPRCEAEKSEEPDHTIAIVVGVVAGVVVIVIIISSIACLYR